jgi:hypothetical protein
MPDLSAAVLARVREILERPDVVKVKRTDDANVGLALFEGGTGIWVDLKAGHPVKAGTIGGKKVSLKKPAKYEA